MADPDKSTTTTEKQPKVTPEELLRKAFDRKTIGLLPKLTCRDCANYKVDCKQHRKQKCPDCGNWISTAHIHLDYVGHAAVTDRLLSVDPNWSWEPMALTEVGLPALDGNGNLWIKLTVLGVTRLGVGDGNNMKELIGDAIRNAAMRFGVALDLWSKEELESVADDPSRKNEKPSADIRTPAEVEEDEARERRLIELGDELWDVLKMRYPARKIRPTIEGLTTVEDREKALERLTHKPTEEPDDEAPIDLAESQAEIDPSLDGIDLDTANEPSEEEVAAQMLADAKKHIAAKMHELGVDGVIRQKAYIHKLVGKSYVETMDEADKVMDALSQAAPRNEG